jgi:hypothetical protein
MSNEENEENISKHAVTDPKKCREIADKYDGNYCG